MTFAKMLIERIGVIASHGRDVSRLFSLGLSAVRSEEKSNEYSEMRTNRTDIYIGKVLGASSKVFVSLCLNLKITR